MYKISRDEREKMLSSFCPTLWHNNCERSNNCETIERSKEKLKREAQREAQKLLFFFACSARARTARIQQ